MSNEDIKTLDMRGKKKKTEWEKHEAGDWLPRTPIGANRHYRQSGLIVTEAGRYHQRKVYPTEMALKRALLSMLPKNIRDVLEVDFQPYDLIWGSKNGYLASFNLKGTKVSFGTAGVRQRDTGWSLKYAEDTIRSITKELLNEPLTITYFDLDS